MIGRTHPHAHLDERLPILSRLGYLEPQHRLLRGHMHLRFVSTDEDARRGTDHSRRFACRISVTRTLLDRQLD